MQKNWYIVYTKPKSEKKVAALFTKKKIENFCPLNCKQIRSSWRNKTLQEPLFSSYVFAYITETETIKIKQTDGVISLVYWKGSPAIIKHDEIEAIKGFTIDYHNIKLERTIINPNDIVRIVDGPDYSIEGKVLTVKNKTVKVNLPSLGYTMIAEMETEDIMGRGISFGNKELLLQ